MATSPDDFLESYRDHNLNKENIKATSSGKISTSKSKINQLGNFNLKSPITTPRQPNESFKSTINASKLLNTRKSHDISYLTKHKQKSSNDIFSGTINSITLGGKGKQIDIKGTI